ncbi:hypothetical protein TASIC1_0009011000 [Trichoderma asperellum]|uniref:Uncharacterized protein n=1 Tax=Trichoderma asperellum TaxID=101201 RepID=A0A6V8R599_TRIAP|nr:hypothetical protein TASIC1_0009011000 [Trichoderma asperellum]
MVRRHTHHPLGQHISSRALSFKTPILIIRLLSTTQPAMALRHIHHRSTPRHLMVQLLLPLWDIQLILLGHQRQRRLHIRPPMVHIHLLGQLARLVTRPRLRILPPIRSRHMDRPLFIILLVAGLHIILPR